tara:strand:+ start:878 stop:1663 length:786 start_codon:yes stop_codon:yes gene_type:complete
MKITLFTSNKSRHNYLINLLSSICDELFVIQECNTIFPGLIPGNYPVSSVMEDYFKKVNIAQNKLFENSYIDNKKNIKILPMVSGDLKKCSVKFLSDFLNSDIYIVFGSSYIKGDLVEFLIKQKTINIHMGVSPYYRGADCNFWALYDNNPHLVGATIHLLSKGLDSGPILYHAMSDIKTDPFEYSMSSVKSAFHSLAKKIKDKSIFSITPLIQNLDLEIRYSKKIEFNEAIVKEYYQRKINLKIKKFDNTMLKEPFFLKN